MKNIKEPSGRAAAWGSLLKAVREGFMPDTVWNETVVPYQCKQDKSVQEGVHLIDYPEDYLFIESEKGREEFIYFDEI